MAGGEGSRLRPVTSNIPKPLVPIGNQPIMQHIVSLLRRHGIEEVVATLHYLADEIQSYFDDGSDFGVRMHYSIEDTPLGTAGSVKQAEHLLHDGTFFIVSGDAMTDCDLSKALEFHREKKAIATLILYRVTSPLEFGVVITEEGGQITRFLEKPSWSEVFSDTVNTGMYILEPEIFELMESGKQYDWSQDIFPRLLAEGRPIFGYVMNEYWCDVGNLTQYREAQEHLLSGQTTLPISGTEIQKGVWTGANAVIEAGAELVPPVYIGSNTKVKSGARVGPYSVIGDNGLIEGGANIERSVVWDSAYIGANSTIRSATLCSRVTVKRDVAVLEDAVVGDRCMLDVGSTIRPKIKLWPDKVVERGSTVTMSLVWGNKWRGSLFRELGVAGLSNIEITPDYATRLGSAFGSTFAERTKIVTSRDSSRSSRMIKRATIASLLSVGCDVLDLRSSPVPITRHFIRASGAGGAINVRKMPDNRRVTLIEMFDARGAYLSKSQERKVETAFFREDFHRTDPDDLGTIEFASRAIEEYQNDYFQQLQTDAVRPRLRVVCDHGYGSISAIFPAMLARLGVDAISVNGFNDAKMAPRTDEEIERHLTNLSQIVGTLDFDLGALITDEGQRLSLVNGKGQIIEGTSLFAAICYLLSKTRKIPSVAMPVTAPNRLEKMLTGLGVQVIRTKSDVRSLTSSSLDAGVDVAGDDRGGLLWPSLHPGFDAMFTLGKLFTMLGEAEMSVEDVIEGLPTFNLAYERVRCPWDMKGGVMRKIAEQYSNAEQIEMVDGIKIYDGDSWVLVLPDSIEPVFHVYAESDADESSRQMVGEYARRIEELQLVT